MHGKNPVIAIIAAAMKQYRERCLQAGMNNYVTSRFGIACKDSRLFCVMYPYLEKDMSQLMGLAENYPALNREPHPQKAWDFIADTLHEAESRVTILSLGGFTNLAKMFEERPDAKLDKIERIVAMGGALYVDGNVAALNNAKEKWNQGPAYATNYRAEFNIFIDPVAASAVFDSRIPLTLVPLDACNYVMLDKSFIDRITASDHLASLASEIFTKKTGSSSEGIPAPIFDPLATTLMTGSVQPNQAHNLNLDVSLTEIPEDNRCGQTSVNTFLEDQRLIQVVQGVSQKAFRDNFANIINRDTH